MSNLIIPENPLIEHVSIAKAQELIDSGALVVDIRELHECVDNIPGSIHVPMSAIRAKSLKVSDFSTKEPVLLQCQSSRRTKVFGELFKQFAGDAEVYALEGGMNQWKPSGASTQTLDPSTLQIGS